MHSKQLQDWLAVICKSVRRDRHSRFIRVMTSGLLSMTLMLVSLALPPASQAAALIVTNANDTGPGSLRQAVLDANATIGVDDVISFAPGLSGQIIHLVTPITISDNLTIAGPGKAQLTLELVGSTNIDIYDGTASAIAVTISGLSITGSNNQLGAITTGENLTLDDIAISNTCSPGNGAVFTYSSVLTVKNTVFSGNHCVDSGAGAIESDSSKVLIENSTFLNNTGRWAGAVMSYGSELTVIDSTFTGNSGQRGAGIFSFYSSMLSVTGSTISGNLAEVYGGGINASEIQGPVTIQNSIISGNSAPLGGGGLYAFRYNALVAPGAVETTALAGEWRETLRQHFDQRRESMGWIPNLSVVNSSAASLPATGPLEITTTRISGNQASGNQSGAGMGGGAYFEQIDAIIRDSEISQNTSSDLGGGIVMIKAGSGSGLQNVTISGNQAAFGGGLALVNTGDVAVELITLANNTGTTSGGGLYARNGLGAGTRAVLVENSLIAGNSANSGANDLATDAALLDLAYSLVQAPGTAAVNDNGGNLLIQDPLLGPLEDNGGVTFTHLPAFNSPAINSGNPVYSAVPASDQRGGARVLSGRVDMGAVELNPGTLSFPIPNLITTEGDKLLTFSVIRMDGGDGARTANYSTADISATAGKDYTFTSGSLHWASGELGVKTFTVTILEDAQWERDEYLTLALFLPGESMPASTAILRIHDNDYASLLPMILLKK